MLEILPLQKLFDKDIPDNFGNFEFRQEHKLLMAMDQLITSSRLEFLFIGYFLDKAYQKKLARVSGTEKRADLTGVERMNVHVDAVMSLRASILRKRLGVSLRTFSLMLSHSDLYKWFCGINRFSVARIPGKSKLGDLENTISPELLEEVERVIFQTAQSVSVIPEPLDFSKAYFDTTCIKVNIHHPVDWLLLRDSARTMMKAVSRIRKAGLLCRMPCEPEKYISQMNKLCMEMTFATRKVDSKKKRKAVYRKMKKLLKVVAGHANNHYLKLESDWEKSNLSRGKVEQILKQISTVTSKLATVIKQSHERIIGERKVANKDKILSLYEEDVNVIVRHKAGAETEFGNKLYLAEQENGLIVDWCFFRDQNPTDSHLLKDSHVRIEKNLGVKVELMAGDRGFDSKDNSQYMEQENIFNAVCPRDPSRLKEKLRDDTFRQAQTRRSQTEARISILSHGFCGKPMKQKGFDHREIHMGLSVLSHNLWVLARIMLAQEKQLRKTA